MEDIRLLLDIAQQGWDEIESEMQRLGGYDVGKLCVKKEKLKNLLEEIRENLEMWLLSLDDALSKRTILPRLERLLNISEKLKQSYTFSVYYTESSLIASTIELGKR